MQQKQIKSKASKKGQEDHYIDLDALLANTGPAGAADDAINHTQRTTVKT